MYCSLLFLFQEDLETEAGSTLAEDLEAEEVLMVLKVGNSLSPVMWIRIHCGP